MPVHSASTTLGGPFFVRVGFALRPRKIARESNPLAAARREEQPMTAATWITMFAVMAFVWGGFLTVLVTAIRKESEKSGDA